VFSLTTHAYLAHPERVKIKRYVCKILDYYIRVKKQFTEPYWGQAQFIMLRAVSENNQKMLRVVETVSVKLYSSENDIEMHLKALVK
jgi:hypothetical protein